MQEESHVALIVSRGSSTPLACPGHHAAHLSPSLGRAPAPHPGSQGQGSPLTALALP